MRAVIAMLVASQVLACSGHASHPMDATAKDADPEASASKPAIDRMATDAGTTSDPTRDAAEPPASSTAVLTGRANDGPSDTTGDAAMPGTPHSDDWQAIAGGNRRSCGIHLGRLWCWGQNGDGMLGVDSADLFDRPTEVGSESDWQVIAMCDGHACGVRGGQLWCWGSNPVGQLGVGDQTDRPVPTRVGADDDWTDVGVERDHSCGVRGGALYCWGLNEFGQLGSGDVVNQWIPVQVGGASNWQHVVPAEQSTCALHDDGELDCWGRNNAGQLGFTTEYPFEEHAPRLLSTDWSALSNGNERYCGVQDGALRCWGMAWDYSSPTSMVQLGSDAKWSAVAVGSNHACAIDDGALWCWGANDFYGAALGQAHTGPQVEPARVGAAAGDWDVLAVGATHACAIRRGALYCWGENEFGQLGTGDLTVRTAPTQIGGP